MVGRDHQVGGGWGEEQQVCGGGVGRGAAGGGWDGAVALCAEPGVSPGDTGWISLTPPL